GVVVDAYNIWWDPNVHRALARAGGRILSYQVSDWVTPLPAGALQGRALPGDGCVDFRGLGAAVDAAGYTGLVEVEIFAADLAGRSGDEVLALVCDRYLKHVA
ncbi:MAG: sugar phosphate isomerase/epimerase, partial [Acidothermales bacterium]|nr:sugar phosphate isomerase/epimerase [Acidothermales bacterium]